jgi:hypothetical protein
MSYPDRKLNQINIGSLDNLRREVTNTYARGEITDRQYKNLENEISLVYEEIYEKESAH